MPQDTVVAETGQGRVPLLGVTFLVPPLSPAAIDDDDGHAWLPRSALQPGTRMAPSPSRMESAVRLGTRPLLVSPVLFSPGLLQPLDQARPVSHPEPSVTS